MSEELGNHGRRFEGGDDFQGAAALRTLLEVDSEHAFEHPGLS
jgi:hypothetical protein